MRRIFFFTVVLGLQLIGLRGYSQWKTYIISPKGDTLNCVDGKDLKQGRWVNHFDEVRGEPGYEEEGVYKDSKKEGTWRIYDLMGDLTGVEYYRWGMKDGVQQYFGMNGSLLREENWRAMNPDKQYDTVQVALVDKLDSYKTVVVKNEGAAIKDGTWKFYNPATGMVDHTEVYTLGKLEKPGASSATAAAANAPQTAAKPKEVLEFEKKAGGSIRMEVRISSDKMPNKTVVRLK
jgi:hypothetical protein